ncbi:MAG: 50S ribosomal protein L25/general stress protein Ctc [Alphaproteobacteria bacterium]|nr:50S ribosomal protein L25/general stress protein Ctc [Alphaproteobacteria bacterium]
MRQMQELRAEARTGTGKGPSYRVRQRGLVPGVVYGGDGTPENVAVNARELERHVETGTFLTTLFALDVDGKKTRVIPRQLQLDPVSDRPVHVDFMRLPEGATITLKIPVRFKGQLESPGLKRGGVLNIVRHEVELICPADIIPEFIEGDLAGMEVHDSLHISHFKLPEGVRPTVDRDFTIASIVAPTSVIEEQRAAAAAAAATGSAPAAEEAAAPAAAPAAKAAEKK